MPPQEGFHIDINSIDAMIGWLHDNDVGYNVRAPRTAGDCFEFTYGRGLEIMITDFKLAIDGYRWLVKRAMGEKG